MTEILRQVSEAARCQLKVDDGLSNALELTPVLPCADLRIQWADIEQDTALLEGERPLDWGDAGQGVVPSAKRKKKVIIIVLFQKIYEWKTTRKDVSSLNPWYNISYF